MYGYSYEHYADKLEIRHIRFSKIMPNTIKTMQKAEKENWDNSRLALELEVEIDDLEKMKQALIEQLELWIIQMQGEVFIESIKQSIKNAIDKGLVTTESDIEALISQICYKVLDFEFLLKEENKSISDYDEK